ncbi:tRNA (N6-isopentenyl adenosine(37)-C2)-methylthiotransferase MiaB [Candidatus Hepatobacter penaei]|uniref:tRNA (N6-isopentenyl adenosine(37)-C2)-methylthiotransferase MiaB n=1 Tax=Candidatus Hepatobacter penaei TaxID=1274402 RepID=UPI0009E6537B|nr:tRNA (N6-isopentenyl adenosine(37)-C2)-methylthiotransferase MiaB [Candidatus Hepatobacter penaei]
MPTPPALETPSVKPRSSRPPAETPSKRQPSKTHSVYIKTYGCQMNVYDATRMADVLKTVGYEVAPGPEEADLVLLNTCHIREKASEKVFSELGRLHQLQKKRTRPMMLGVAGCVAQAEGKEIQRRAPYVNLVFGPQTYHLLPSMLKEVEAHGPSHKVLMLDFPSTSKFDFLPEETLDKGPVSFLTIQEGCDKFCTYCVVPYTRGIEVSRPVDDVMAEAVRLVEGGAQEIVVLGQNVSAYHGQGPEGTHYGLGDLLRGLAMRLEKAGLKRLRYTTSHPRDTQSDLIKAHGELDMLMPFLHLPVQSGSDRVLKAMNRQHPRARYLDVIQRFRQARPDIALSSDFIVGFPGETEEDFEDTLSLVREVGYAQAYSFKYSPRPGTPGALREDQIPEEVKAERLARLQALLNAQQLAFNQRFEGQTVEVLIERQGRLPHQWIGRTPYMQSVHITTEGLHKGAMVKAHITKGLANSLEGTWVRHAA